MTQFSAPIITCAFVAAGVASYVAICPILDRRPHAQPTPLWAPIIVAAIAAFAALVTAFALDALAVGGGL